MAAELAKKLANPVAALISVPLQFNVDDGIGPENEGTTFLLNLQPVVPITLNHELNLISRTIIPLMDQEDVPVRGQGESGLGDIVASQFVSPKEPTASGWILGAGPVELLPSATDETLGREQWGLGPTAVGLKQHGPWTYGALVNHLWSIANEDDHADVNATFAQPFLTFITKQSTTLAINLESTYDWNADQWSIPVNANISQLLKVGTQMISLGVGARYWMESPDAGPEGWGARVTLTLLFPK